MAEGRHALAFVALQHQSIGYAIGQFKASCHLWFVALL